MTERIKPDSFVTLHYRLATTDGLEVANTFPASPATLQMGNGQLAPTLEQCLLDMAEGERRSFELAPEDAFGPRNPDLIHRVSRSELPPKAVAEPHEQIDFTTPGGQRFSGLVLEVDAQGLLMDFNHPLAGRRIQFEALVIGVL
ncbi:MAG: peptidylprolyl isomerase [Rhodocyclaceae bacterium]|nr:peptidylprolyl isomerase [Rhodocyclaceae bacterium]